MSAARVGLVGLGQMGRHHAQAYRAAGARLAAVCDADAARAEAFGREFGAPWCASLDELLATPGLEAVSICAPPHVHLPMLRSALAAGLDVLCEKPLAGSLADARAMAALDTSRHIVMVCFFHRFHEPIDRLRELLAAGTLGAPRLLRNRFALDMRADRRDWIWDPMRAGGGAVLNTSVHSIDLFRFLLGEPERVGASLRPKPTESTLERDAVLLLEAADEGPSGILEAISFAVQKEYSLTLETEDAVAEVGWDPPRLRLRRVGEPEWREVPIAAPSPLSRIDAGVRHFLACVAERRQPRAGLGDGVRALEIAAAAYESGASGRFVACGARGGGGGGNPLQTV